MIPSSFQPPEFTTLLSSLEQTLWGPGEVYDRLNTARALFNEWASGQFEWYLEDEWNHQQQGQTWLEHHIRCLTTRNEFGPIGYDVYLNHRDAKGVWHLDDYQHSCLCLPSLEALQAYLLKNLPTLGLPAGL